MGQVVHGPGLADVQDAQAVLSDVQLAQAALWEEVQDAQAALSEGQAVGQAEAHAEDHALASLGQAEFQGPAPGQVGVGSSSELNWDVRQLSRGSSGGREARLTSPERMRPPPQRRGVRRGLRSSCYRIAHEDHEDWG